MIQVLKIYIHALQPLFNDMFGYSEEVGKKEI